MVKLLLGLFLTALLWNGASATESHKVINVYGLEQGKQLNRGKQDGVSYILQIGAFKNQDNALKCKKNYSNKTTFQIRVQKPAKKNGTYFVVMGPFTDPLELRNVSQQLLSEPKIQPHTSFAKVTLAPKLKETPVAINSPPVNQTSFVEPQVKPAPKPLPLLPQEESSLVSVTSAKSQQLLADTSVSKQYSQVLMDNETLQSNQIAKQMQSTRKMKLGSIERKSIENRTWELKEESLAIDLKLKTETNTKKIAVLEKRKESINNELEKIVAMVIKRISVG